MKAHNSNFWAIYINLHNRGLYEVVVASFFKYFKSSIFAFAGGSPPCTPRRSAGGRPIGQEIMQNQWGQFCENQLSFAKLKKKKGNFLKFFCYWSCATAAAHRHDTAILSNPKKNYKRNEKKLQLPLRHTLCHATAPPCTCHAPLVCPCIIKLLNQ